MADFDDTRRTIARILKVNHAGEHGAIRIYGAQIFVARFFYPDIVPKLQEMLGHEISHLNLFKADMDKRGAWLRLKKTLAGSAC